MGMNGGEGNQRSALLTRQNFDYRERCLFEKNVNNEQDGSHSSYCALPYWAKQDKHHKYAIIASRMAHKKKYRSIPSSHFRSIRKSSHHLNTSHSLTYPSPSCQTNVQPLPEGD